MAPMDDVDKAILNRIQSNFPIAQRPYRVIGMDLNISETEILSRLKRLKADGIIRRIGGNFTPGKLGFVSTLCAASVPEDKIDTFARIVNRYPGVTHNYQRDSKYNIWFTFISPSMNEIEENLRKIALESGITDILNLPATKVFKIRAEFELK